MREASLEEVKNMAANARENIWAAARDYGREPKIYLHWTAGHYGSKFDDYHVNIDAEGRFWVEHDFDDVIPHTWRRNSGAVGLSMDCCAFATSQDLGDEPPTTAQIDAMAQAIAVIADALWVTIDKQHVLTHGEAADNEDGIAPHEEYGCKTTCERWDLEYLGTEESPSFNPYDTTGKRGGDVLRGKALWYKNEWEKGK